jgi:hypothetical protein
MTERTVFSFNALVQVCAVNADTSGYEYVHTTFIMEYKLVLTGEKTTRTLDMYVCRW